MPVSVVAAGPIPTLWEPMRNGAGHIHIRAIRGVIGDERSPHQRELLVAECEIERLGRRRLQERFVERPGGKKVYSLPTIDFIDAFGLYRNMYRALLGVYSMPACLQQPYRRQQRFHATVTLGPFGASLNQVVDAIGPGLKTMYAGIDLVLGGEDNAFVWSGPIAFTGDMVQQHKNAGIQEPRSTRFCRICRTTRDECRHSVEDSRWLSDPDRMRWPLEDRRRRATMTPARLAKEEALLRDPPWDAWVPILTKQMPWDFNHLEIKGMCERIQTCFMTTLSASGKLAFSSAVREVARTLPAASGWARMQDPISHYKSFQITEIAQLAILLPFVVNALKPTHIQTRYLVIIQEVFDVDTDQAALDVLVNLFREVALLLRYGLAREISRQEIGTYQNLVVRVRQLFLQLKEVHRGDGALYTRLERFPNLHGAIHSRDDLLRYGPFPNVSSSLGEEMHKVYKDSAQLVSPVNPNLALLRRMNIFRSVQAVLEGGLAVQPDVTFLSELVHSMRGTCPLLISKITLFKTAGTRAIAAEGPINVKARGRRPQPPASVSVDGEFFTRLQMSYRQYTDDPETEVDLTQELAVEPGSISWWRSVVMTTPSGQVYVFSLDQYIWHPHGESTARGNPTYNAGQPAVAGPGLYQDHAVARVDAVFKYNGSIWVLLQRLCDTGRDNNTGARVLSLAARDTYPMPAIELLVRRDPASISVGPHLIPVPDTTAFYLNDFTRRIH